MVMKNLINRSYEAIKKRGLIKDTTSGLEFINKAEEELKEWKEAYLTPGIDLQKCAEEATDLATVCFMWLLNVGYNPIDEFEKVVIKNEKRANETV